MKRILLSAAVLVAVGAFLVIAVGASNQSNATGTYKIQLDNAFGLVQGADFKVAGVPAGKIQKIDLQPSCINGGGNATCRALVTVSVTQRGFGQFHSDAFCESRPQSLIGEYFVECQPGSQGPVLKPGSIIPVSHTQSTIPGDLLQDVMRLPYRERFTLIINELGAAVAGRSDDLQAALRRAVPALTQTDNLLNLLANDSSTLQALTSDSNTVITALANNSAQVTRFVDEAGRTANDTSTQDASLRSSLQQFPGFLEQLKPTMAKLGTAVDANEPVLANLNAATGHNGSSTTGPDRLHELFTDIAPCSTPHSDNQCGFADASKPAIKALGQASAVGTPAMKAAQRPILHLNQFAQATPELAQNLAIVLADLDNRSRAVEPDSRSPGGKGFTGLEALLQYVFNQPLAINSYSQFGHLLAVDAFIDPRCSPYATPQSIANSLAAAGPSYRQCYSWLGPNQPGINEPDPSNPGACVPDPGGAPPGEPGPQTSACKLQPNPATPKAPDTGSGSSPNRSSNTPVSSKGSSSGNGTGSRGGGSSGSGLAQTLGHIFSALGGGTNAPAPAATSSAPTAAAPAGGTGSSGGSSTSQAQQLLNYLLAP